MQVPLILKNHLVCCPKYRRKVLVGVIIFYLISFIYHIASHLGIEEETVKVYIEEQRRS